MSTATPHLDSVVPEMELGPLWLRPRWSLIRITIVSVLVLSACALVPVLLTAVTPPVYGGQVELLLKPRSDVSDTAVERAMLTEEVVLTSPAVLGPVADRAGMSVQDLREAVTTGMVGRSNVLRVTVGDRDQERAVALAQAIERQYAELHASEPAVDPSVPGGPTLTYSTLTPARATEEPLAPNPLQALAGGLLVGLVLATATAGVLLRPTIGAPRPIRR